MPIAILLLLILLVLLYMVGFFGFVLKTAFVLTVLAAALYIAILLWEKKNNRQIQKADKWFFEKFK